MKKFLLLLFVISFIASGHTLSQTVYITKTGKKYHVVTCRYLSRSPIPISLSDAIAEGYTPCSVCDPPVKVRGTKSQKVYNANSVLPRRAVAVQCSAKTKSGARCRRMTKSPNGLCWQHGGN
ncbi:MAG: hypothetical protein ACTHJN_10630 [Ginsengibacter sp.]